ncbi:uncharacterized protein LOC128667611 [Microplitis demolitor]|uniref:uncharacterized protein LOC128667611 n=1 Tax=Microplitis demolitor TaxID=69319 RepID=UPI0004CDBF09|nr:uncharacterized protein LOC128667611 [Microplitis demolitor]
MDIDDDEDIFEISDDESTGNKEIPCSYNPIDDHLMKQLNDVKDCISKVKKETENVQSLGNKIINKLYKKCQYVVDDESSDDDELYDANSEPVIKRKKMTKEYQEPLVVTDVWQRIIDDKWVIGVDLENNSQRVLEKPRLFIMISGERVIKGVTSFWEIINDSLWNRTRELHPESDEIVATAVLDLPTFNDTCQVKVYGTVSYTMDEIQLQAPINFLTLTTTQAIDKSLTPRHAKDLHRSVVAMKAAAIEKIIALPLYGEGRGIRILSFIESKDFKEILSDVHVSKNPEIFRHCLIEILSVDNAVTMRISARSTAQLNILTHMLRAEFPDASETGKPDKVADAMAALEKELELKLGCDEPMELLKAKVVTDLLIP